MNAMFAQRLRVVRKARGLRQNELAGVAGIDAQAISRFERGHRLPSADTLAALCAGLDVSADYLLGLTSTPARDDLVRSVCYEDTSMFPEWWVLDASEHCLPCAADVSGNAAKAGPQEDAHV